MCEVPRIPYAVSLQGTENVCVTGTDQSISLIATLRPDSRIANDYAVGIID